jgi:hypothetical protein
MRWLDTSNASAKKRHKTAFTADIVNVNVANRAVWRSLDYKVAPAMSPLARC